VVLLTFSGIAEWTGGTMSVAFSLMARIRHRLLLALSPAYRGVRARLEEIASD
jgi:hypothetical protein